MRLPPAKTSVCLKKLYKPSRKKGGKLNYYFITAFSHERFLSMRFKIE